MSKYLSEMKYRSAFRRWAFLIGPSYNQQMQEITRQSLARRTNDQQKLSQTPVSCRMLQPLSAQRHLQQNMIWVSIWMRLLWKQQDATVPATDVHTHQQEMYKGRSNCLQPDTDGLYSLNFTDILSLLSTIRHCNIAQLIDWKSWKDANLLTTTKTSAWRIAEPKIIEISYCTPPLLPFPSLSSSFSSLLLSFPFLSFLPLPLPFITVSSLSLSPLRSKPLKSS